MTLLQWLANHWLERDEPGRQEISDLLDIVNRDLAACRSPGLAADWQLAIAYNAALEAATMALRASGFRIPKGSGRHHQHTIESLTLTIEEDRSIVNRLQKLQKKRHTAGYDRAGTISDAEAKEMISLAEHLRKDVLAWLRERHPRLLQE